MRKICIAAIVLLTLARPSLAQNIPGYSTGNYAGISGFTLNPASIAGSRYKFDMTLTGFGFSFFNNYIQLKQGYYHTILDTLMRPGGSADFKHQLIINTNDKPKHVYNEMYIQMPSFMVALSRTTSIAFNWRIREIFNLDNITSTLARQMYAGLELPEYYNVKLKNEQFSMNTMAWSEMGIGFAQVIKGNKKHLFSVGGQLKLISGFYSYYLYANDLNYSWRDSKHLDVFSTDFSYGRSDNFDRPESINQTPKYKHITKPSIGADMGVIYEYRPHYKDYLYDLDGQKDLERKDENKYLFKVGVSLVDLGRIKYTKASSSGDFHADVRNMSTDTFNKDHSVLAIDSTLRHMFTFTPLDAMTYNMALPTALSVQVDYHIWKGFYANFVSYVSPRFIKDVSKVHSMNFWDLSPRWESKWFGVYIPMGFNGYGKFTMGTGLRLGPVVIASMNAGNMLLSKSTGGIDIHAALKIPIAYGKPHDKDHDGVSNKRDHCPKDKGTWITHGCPDRDQDGVADKEDKCPDVPGLPKFNGCPDTDGDGIVDADDACPTEPGLAKFGGCPDRDNDDVPDRFDDCPDDPGTVATKGCPDKDNDGIVDILDRCPDIAGVKGGSGCPDGDNDGVYDPDDKCPTEAGPADNFGCPYGDKDKDGTADKFDHCPDIAGPKAHHGCPDSDNDGLFDDEDDCPMTAGPASNKGCPVIEKKEAEVVNTALKNLELESGKAIILESSYPTLEDLAKLLKEKPNFKLEISGHTDNVGSAAANMDLSKRRAEAVQKFLVDHGVKKDQIIVKYFGSTKPIDTNDTPEGRQHNRRVEMKIVFD